MAKITFFCSKRYFGADLTKKAMGGISSGTIKLAESLAKLGHDVTIYNKKDNDDAYNGVQYKNIDSAHKVVTDLAISNNTANHLLKVKSGKCVVWQRNMTSLTRAWKRHEFWALLKKRPHLVCLSDDALKRTPKYLPYKTLNVIPHAIEDLFLDNSSLGSKIENRAFFASRPSRNLDFAITAWKDNIHPQLPEAEFHICSPTTKSEFPYSPEELKKHNIIFHGSLPKQELSELAQSCKLLLYPGHKNETGCQVALQAVGLGIPIISCGHGSLSDIVLDGETGFIATDIKTYGERAIEVFGNNNLWNKLHQNSLKHSWRKSYDQRAQDWLKTFNIN